MPFSHGVLVKTSFEASIKYDLPDYGFLQVLLGASSWQVLLITQFSIILANGELTAIERSGATNNPPFTAISGH